MSCRPHGGKPTIALWMLVAVADLLVLAAATGVVVTLLLATVVVLAGGVVAARRLGRRAQAPADTVVRRRA